MLWSSVAVSLGRVGNAETIMAVETLWAEFLQRLLLGATLAGPAVAPPLEPSASIRPAAAAVAGPERG